MTAQPIEKLKKCYRCGESKPTAQFSRGCSRCKPCDTEHFKQWRSANREKWNERKSRWRRLNPEKVSAQGRRRRLHVKYGVTQAWYEQKHQDQRGCCAICGSREELVIDHNHRTGAVRDLLCNICNTALGFVEKHKERLSLCAGYLERHGA